MSSLFRLNKFLFLKISTVSINRYLLLFSRWIPLNSDKIAHAWRNSFHFTNVINILVNSKGCVVVMILMPWKAAAAFFTWGSSVIHDKRTKGNPITKLPGRWISENLSFCLRRKVWTNDELYESEDCAKNKRIWILHPCLRNISLNFKFLQYTTILWFLLVVYL